MRFVPGEGAWDARCYDDTMLRVVLRMRELFRSGVARASIGPRIDAEMKAGTLKVPLIRRQATARSVGPTHTTLQRR